MRITRHPSIDCASAELVYPEWLVGAIAQEDRNSRKSLWWNGPSAQDANDQDGRKRLQRGLRKGLTSSESVQRPLRIST